MAIASRFRDFFQSQTAMDKLALSLVWMSMSIVNPIYFVGNVVLTAWIVYEKHRHKERMTNFTT